MGTVDGARMRLGLLRNGTPSPRTWPAATASPAATHLWPIRTRGGDHGQRTTAEPSATATRRGAGAPMTLPSHQPETAARAATLGTGHRRWVGQWIHAAAARAGGDVYVGSRMCRRGWPAIIGHEGRRRGPVA